MDYEQVKQVAFKAAEASLRLALAVQLTSWHALLDHLKASAVIGPDDVQSILLTMANNMPCDDNEGPTKVLFDALARHSADLRDFASKFALADMPSEGQQQ